MHIRPATVADREAVVSLVQRVLQEFELPWDPQGMDAELFTIPHSYSQRGGWFDVVVDEHEAVVGTIGLLPVGDGVIELRKMYLQRSARGGGMGRRLVQRAIDRARAVGYQRLELETAAVLEAAVALYRSMGFQTVGEATCQRVCDYRMAISLHPDDRAKIAQQQGQQ
jgi:putative acetyltransferase